MKKKTRFAAIITAFLLTSHPHITANAESKIVTDVTSDGVTDIFDVAALRGSLGKADCDIDNSSVTNKTDLNYLSRYIVRESLENSYIIDSDAILEPMNTVHTGDGTFYGGGYEGGCAMLDPISKDDCWIVAMNLADYNEGQLAGAYIEVTGELGTIEMFVSDLLPEGKKGDLDLYTEAFPLIAPVEKGRVPVSWHIIPLYSAENAPVSFVFKEGSSEFWSGVQVRNHRYPITKLEYLNKDGEFVEVPRRRYNYFESREFGAGPYTFRITDIYGHVIVEENIPLVLDETVSGENQFPY